jgi:hypothetical protein
MPIQAFDQNRVAGSLSRFDRRSRSMGRIAPSFEALLAGLAVVAVGFALLFVFAPTGL